MTQLEDEIKKQQDESKARIDEDWAAFVANHPEAQVDQSLNEDDQLRAKCRIMAEAQRNDPKFLAARKLTEAYANHQAIAIGVAAGACCPQCGGTRLVWECCDLEAVEAMKITETAWKALNKTGKGRVELRVRIGCNHEICPYDEGMVDEEEWEEDQELSELIGKKQMEMKKND